MLLYSPIDYFLTFKEQFHKLVTLSIYSQVFASFYLQNNFCFCKASHMAFCDNNMKVIESVKSLNLREKVYFFNYVILQHLAIK